MYPRTGWILSALKMEAISGMGLSLDGRYHGRKYSRCSRIGGVNGSSVEGRVRGLSENYLGFRALEFRPLNPVSVGLRIYARNLNAIFLFVILYRLILNPLLIAPAEFGTHPFTLRNVFLLLLLRFLLACCRFE